MTPSQLSERLAGRVESVAKHLLPNGRRMAQEFVAGSLGGEAGDSLKVRLSGGKIGVWSDFATGQSGGDLLDLWCAVRGCDLKQAMDESASWLGLSIDGTKSRPKKTYRSPDRPKEAKRLESDSAVTAYFRTRGITETTLAAFKIAELPGSARFPRLGGNPATIVFPYLRDGRLLNCKYLALLRDADGKKHTTQESNAEPCLFGWQTIPAHTRAVVITEGEIDAMTLYQFGVPALSVPMGGGGGAKQDWIESDYDHLQRFDTIFVGLDMDGPGREGAQEIIRRLGAERCRMIEWPHKDANECLKQGFTKEDFARCIMTAKTQDPEELRPADAYTGAVLHEFFPAPDTPRGLATPWEKVGDHLRFRPSEVTIWGGYSGHGKSIVLNHVAAAGLARDERFCIASMEMPPPRTLWRLVRQLTAQEKPTAKYIEHCMTWLGDKLWLFDLLGTAKTDRMLEVFAYAAKRYQIRQFIVDSISKCGIAEDDYNGQKAIVERLVDFAHRHESHIHLVSHARKGSDEYSPPGKMDFKGTGAITDMADNVITVFRNKKKEEKISIAQAEGRQIEADVSDKPDAYLMVSKQRYTGWEGDIYLWFHPGSLQYLERNGRSPNRYVKFESGQYDH
jgi:twinkle protein